MDRIVSARVEAQPWYVRLPRAVPIGIFLLTMAITAISVLTIERVEADRRTSNLRETTASAASTLTRRSMAHIMYLRAGAVLFSQRQLTPDNFREFSSELEKIDETHNIDGIAWVSRVERAKIAAFEAKRRAEGAAGFAVHPAPPPGRGFVLPITYFARHESARATSLGRDIFSDPGRVPTLVRAAREHQPLATGKVTLLRPGTGNTWTGFVIYMPVFDRTAGGGGRLLGYISASFEGTSLLRSALELEHAPDIGLRLYDGQVVPDRLIGQVGQQGAADQALARPITIADHRFVLVVSTTRSAALSPLSLVTLLLGIMVASLLTIMARLLTSQAEEDRASLTWLREQASIRNSLTRELNHRVKNTLANVLSIVSLTSRRATDLESFVESLNGRIRALSATHDLLTDLDWGLTPLRAVIDMELAPYIAGRDHDITLSGPDVELAPNDALSLGLAIHELVTNATKYGALSVRDGRLVVTWEPPSADVVRVRWVESGGPPVAQQRRRGFGTDLIERIVAQELGGGVELRFDPEGVSCTLAVPVRRPAIFQIRAARAGPAAG